MSENDVQALKRDVQRILFYLHNDDDTSKKGLVAEVADLKRSFSEFMVSYKVEKAFKKGQIGIISLIGGGFALVCEWLIKLFL